MYFSNSFRFISFLLPINTTNGHCGSSAILRILFTPIFEYAAASSGVSVIFSHTGISNLLNICYSFLTTNVFYYEHL